MGRNLGSSVARTDRASTVLDLAGGALARVREAVQGYEGPQGGKGLIALTAVVVAALLVESELLTTVWPALLAVPRP